MTYPRMSAAKLLVHQLQLHGVDRVFCVPGESYLAVLDALVDAPEIEVVVCRHEGGATMMADAYARMSGKPGIAFVTRGPGATNAASGVHVAHQDSTPLILFIGDIERSATGRNSFQEIDFETMFRPFTKFVKRIEDGRRIPELVGRAFHTAMAGRQGPVVLTLHEDMLLDEVEALPARGWQPVEAAPSREAMDGIASMLRAAAKPVLIVGGGWSAAAAGNIRRFAEAWELPVASSFRCMDYMDNSSDCYIGNLGLGANPAVPAAIAESDLVILLGGRLNEVSSGGFKLLQLPLPRQQMVHVHPDPEELGSIYQPTLAINASARTTAEALAALAVPNKRPWAARLPRLREAYLKWTTPSPVHGNVQMGEIMLWLRDFLPDDAILTNGAGNFAIWPNRYHRYRGYGTMLAPRSGSMGYGVPAAIAAKICHPDRTVVCFAGDGDFMMTSSEMATALKHDAPIIIILLNNSTYGTIRMHQERDFPERVSGTSLVNPDFVRYADSFGAFARRVTSTGEFAPAFEAAQESGRLSLIEIVIEPELISPTETITSLRQKARQAEMAALA